MAIVERLVNSLPTSLRKNGEQTRKRLRVGKHTITYNQQQIEQPAAFVSSFLERPDVNDALSHLRRFRPIRLEQKTFRSRPTESVPLGQEHQFLVLKQGSKGFLFDKRPLDATASQEPGHFTWVVPQEVMRAKGLFPTEGEKFRKFRGPIDTFRFFRAIRKQGYLAGRFSGAAVEQTLGSNVFAQPIPAVAVIKSSEFGNLILFSIRSKNGNDKRMHNLIVLPLTMGHIDPTDLGHVRSFIKQAMYRETAEEAILIDERKPGESYDIFPSLGDGYKINIPGILRLRRKFGTIKPLGVLYTQETEMDRGHIALAFYFQPKNDNIIVIAKSDSHETVQTIWLTREAYEAMSNMYDKASWNKILLDNLPKAKEKSRR